jgi:hypothetical protein
LAKDREAERVRDRERERERLREIEKELERERNKIIKNASTYYSKKEDVRRERRVASTMSSKQAPVPTKQTNLSQIDSSILSSYQSYQGRRNVSQQGRRKEFR